MASPSLNLSSCLTFKSHFDVVRKLDYLPHLNTLVSVSEVSMTLIKGLPNQTLEP